MNVLRCRNGITTSGYYTDTYISDRGTQDIPIAGEVGVVRNGWAVGMKQLPGENKTNVVFDITRPVLPYNGKPVPSAPRYGSDSSGSNASTTNADTSLGNSSDASGNTDASGSVTGKDGDNDSHPDTVQSGGSAQKGN